MRWFLRSVLRLAIRALVFVAFLCFLWFIPQLQAAYTCSFGNYFHAWFSGRASESCLVFEINPIWWSRIGKVLQLVGTLTVITELFGPDQIRNDIARTRVHLAKFIWDISFRPIEPWWATWLRVLQMTVIFAIAYAFAFIIDYVLIQPFALLAKGLGPNGAKIWSVSLIALGTCLDLVAT